MRPSVNGVSVTKVRYDMSINLVVLVGRLAFDPEVKALQSGLMVANLTIAVNSRVKAGNEWKDEACFIKCECFGDLADEARLMRKGQSVSAEGRIKYREYTTKDGKQASINTIGLTKLFLVEDECGSKVEAHKIAPQLNTLPF